MTNMIKIKDGTKLLLPIICEVNRYTKIKDFNKQIKQILKLRESEKIYIAKSSILQEYKNDDSPIIDELNFIKFNFISLEVFYGRDVCVNINEHSKYGPYKTVFIKKDSVCIVM